MSDKKGFDLLSLAPDDNMAENGVWLEFFGGSRLKIAKAQNTKHQAFMNKAYKVNRRKLDMEDKNADKLAEDISREAAARYLLKDWEGISINGEMKAYSYELGIEAMKLVPELKSEVDEQSRRLQNFQISDEEEDLENVKTISPGNSNGASQSE